MKKTKLSLDTPCPSCDGALALKALGCSACDLEIKGAISVSPLAKLDSEMTHFLMVFIHCGGKISDVEKALGISYPTVKAKLSKLQNLLSLDEFTEKKEASNSKVLDLLKKLDAGELDYDFVMKQIKQLKDQS